MRTDYSNASLEDLKEELSSLIEQAEHKAELDKIHQDKNWISLLQSIENVANICQCSKNKALKFLMDAEGCNPNDFEYFCYLNDICYSKEKELRNL